MTDINNSPTENVTNPPANLPATTDPKKEFMDGYSDLVTKTGMTLDVTPVFIKRDDGTFSLVLQQNLVLVPKV